MKPTRIKYLGTFWNRAAVKPVRLDDVNRSKSTFCKVQEQEYLSYSLSLSLIRGMSKLFIVIHFQFKHLFVFKIVTITQKGLVQFSDSAAENLVEILRS